MAYFALCQHRLGQELECCEHIPYPELMVFDNEFWKK
jgi:hypothetical protein